MLKNRKQNADAPRNGRSTYTTNPDYVIKIIDNYAHMSEQKLSFQYPLFSVKNGLQIK